MSHNVWRCKTISLEDITTSGGIYHSRACKGKRCIGVLGKLKMTIKVYNRNNILYIRYTIPGLKIYKRESTGLKDTPENRSRVEIIVQEKRLSLLKKEYRLKEEKMLLSDAWEMFYEHRKKLTDHTDTYLYAYNLLKEFFGDIEITNFTEDNLLDFKQFLTGRGAHNTAVTYLNHIRTFFDFLVKRKKLKENFVPKLSNIDMPIVVIPKAHIKKIMNAAKRRDPEQYKYYWFLYLSGFRRSEGLSIKGNNIHLDRRVLDVYNSKKNRWDVFPLIRGLGVFLKDYKKYGDKNLFTFEEDYVTKEFTKLCKSLEYSYTLHDLRRTFGTEMAKIVKPVALMALMRHKDIRTTMKYSKGDLGDLPKDAFKPI
jgi:integrase